VAGYDWYLVESQSGWLFAEAAWVPATEAGRPLFQVIEPICPKGEVDVAELLRLIPAERVLCFGGSEITLAPAKAALVVDEGMAAWPPLLSPDSPWQLF